MQKARFYVDFCYEAGDEYGSNLTGRYWFGIELPDEEYETLYQIWYDQDELNSWGTDWTGHIDLYDKIDGAAIYALNKMLKEENSPFQDPVEVLWELSKETIDAF